MEGGRSLSSDVEWLAGAVRTEFGEGGVTVSIDRPSVEAGGVWWIDIAVAGPKRFAVEWSSRRGIGLHTRERPGYGEGPNETFESREEAWKRLKVLISSVIGRASSKCVE